MHNPTGHRRHRSAGRGRNIPAGGLAPLARGVLGIALLLHASATVLHADVVVIPPAADNTLYEDPNGSLSNGAGERLFAGQNAIPTIRRSVLRFDVSTAVGEGATITSVALTLNVSASAGEGSTLSLHRLESSWGEGASDAEGAEGGGAPAEPGDATWLHRFFDTDPWTTPGGDFDPVASASLLVGVAGAHTWGPTQAMIDDAQAWVDDPASNHGWIVIGDETSPSTAKRFDSVNHPTAAVRPRLEITFVPGVSPAGMIPDGGTVPGTPLTLTAVGGGDLELVWGASCVSGDDDYEIYEGSLTLGFASHEPITCTTGGATSAVITPSAGDRYYLVVPHNGSREGSYGRDRIDGVPHERPASLAPCLPQAIAATCP